MPNSNTPIPLKLILNQIVMSLFGIMLALSTITINSTLCAVIGSVAIFLYLFLIYTTIWEKGARDAILISGARMNFKPLLGLYYALLAAIPTIVLTIIFSVITKSMTDVSNFADITYTASKFILMFIFQGMYHGLAQKFSYHFIFYIITIFPSLIIGTISYIMGVKNIRIIPLKKK